MSTKIFRIGSIFLLISAVSFGWVSLGQKNETKFWNIGAYSIASVSARDDEWEEDEDDDEDNSYESRRRREDENEGYILQENVASDLIPTEPTPVVVAEKITTTTSSALAEPCVAQAIIAPISLEKKILQTLGGLGLGAEQRKILQSQFQGLYDDIALKYPTSSGRIEVLQQLSRQAESKISELRSLPKVDSSTIFTSKIQSLEALRALSALQIESINTPSPIETSIPCPSSATSPIVAVPTPVTVKKSPTPVKVTPVAPKPVTPAPVKTTPAPIKVVPAPVAPKPVAPVVNTRTTAS